VERARVLVTQLLTFSRAQPVRLQRVRVEETVRQTLPLLRRLPGEEVHLEYHGPDEIGAVCVGAGHIEQIVLNLAVNARDAMLRTGHGHPGTGGVLTVALDRADGMARLQLRDTGHGMDADTKARLFEPFFTTKPVGRGTGLGLATVYGIVTEAGGRISVDSEPGKGSTFVVELPLASSSTADVVPLASSSGAPAGSDAQRTASDGGLILLVEDDETVRWVIRRALERGGYRVVEAPEGRQALRLWAEHRTQVAAVVTDCRMPDMGGRALAQSLCRDMPAIPVVFLSGYFEEETMPADGEVFLSKPFTGEQLLQTLATLLQQGTMAVYTASRS
jgi:CheY-like chemotaxis protein